MLPIRNMSYVSAVCYNFFRKMHKQSQNCTPLKGFEMILLLWISYFLISLWQRLSLGETLARSANVESENWQIIDPRTSANREHERRRRKSPPEAKEVGASLSPGVQRFREAERLLRYSLVKPINIRTSNSWLVCGTDYFWW